jgi:hypothetical protein
LRTPVQAGTQAEQCRSEDAASSVVQPEIKVARVTRYLDVHAEGTTIKTGESTTPNSFFQFWSILVNFGQQTSSR